MKTNATPNPSSEIPSLETIQKYLEGAMGVEEKRQFERLMASNPLVMDAVEGLSLDTHQTAQRVSELQDRIESKATSLLAPKTHWLSVTMGMAASIAVLVGLCLMFWLKINSKEISQESSPAPTAQPLAMEPLSQLKKEPETMPTDEAPVSMPAGKSKSEAAPKMTQEGAPPPQSISMKERSITSPEKVAETPLSEAKEEELVSKAAEESPISTADMAKSQSASGPSGPTKIKSPWEDEMLAYVPADNSPTEKKAKRNMLSNAEDKPTAAPVPISEQNPTEASVRAKMAKGLWTEALSELESWEKTKPNEPVCLWLKAIVLLHNGDAEGARLVLDSLTKKPNPYQSKAKEIKARLR